MHPFAVIWTESIERQVLATRNEAIACRDEMGRRMRKPAGLPGKRLSLQDEFQHDRLEPSDDFSQIGCILR